MGTFTSAVLGEVQHPINILKEYLSAFKNKCKAAILSWLDQWTKHKRKKGESPWIWIVLEDLAQELGYCRDTIFRHLKDLLREGIIIRQRAMRWSTDQAWKYRLNTEDLKSRTKSDVLASNKNQTLEVLKSDSGRSDFLPSRVQNSDIYIESSLNSNLATTLNTRPTHPVVVVNECEKEEEVSQEVMCGQSPHRVEFEIEGENLEPINSDEGKFSAADAEILNEIEAIGIHLHPKLEQFVLDAAVDVVRDAIAVVKETRAKETVRNPAGLLVEAIKNKWKPAQPIRVSYPPGFLEWYDRACAAGWVLASEAQTLPVVMGVLNVRVPNPDRCPGYELKPWSVVKTQFDILSR